MRLVSPRPRPWLLAAALAADPAQAAAGRFSFAAELDGQVIHYAVEGAPGRVTMVSAGPGPRFRLTYVLVEKDVVEVRFEIAPAGSPDAFAPYLAGRARRDG